jgi:uncharacterized membrane protein
MKTVKWLIENWSLLVVVVGAIIFLMYRFKNFSQLPSDEQIAKVKVWLLYAVIQAEKELGAGTGTIKLRYVYDLFLSKFPSFASIISFAMFSEWVDEVLEQMKHLLKTNEQTEAYVKGDN